MEFEMVGSAGKNTIQHILESGSPRVLNTLRIGEELKRADPAASLLFQIPIMNRAVLYKDTHFERTSSGETKARIGTKVYVPFDAARPGDGGMTTFYSNITFKGAIGELVDLSDPRRQTELVADMAILDLLDPLPTFAPFLVKDCFDRAGVKVNAAYCMIPDEEWRAIQLYIRERFKQILVSVSGGALAERKQAMDSLIDKLWDLKDVPALQGLATAFGLEPATCLEMFYGWKGILYFAFVFTRLHDETRAILAWFDEWNEVSVAMPAATRAELKPLYLACRKGVAQLLVQVEKTLQEYEFSFEELFVSGTGPQRFIQFLSNANEHFRTCGAGIGLLQHVYELWDRTTRPFPRRRPSLEILRQVLTATADIVGESKI